MLIRATLFSFEKIAKLPVLKFARQSLLNKPSAPVQIRNLTQGLRHIETDLSVFQSGEEVGRQGAKRLVLADGSGFDA